MEFEILDGIIRVLDQTLKIDKLLIDQIRFLKIQFLIMGFLLLLLTLYSVYYICYNSKRITKIEKIIKQKRVLADYVQNRKKGK